MKPEMEIISIELKSISISITRDIKFLLKIPRNRSCLAVARMHEMNDVPHQSQIQLERSIGNTWCLYFTDL